MLSLLNLLVMDLFLRLVDDGDACVFLRACILSKPSAASLHAKLESKDTPVGLQARLGGFLSVMRLNAHNRQSTEKHAEPSGRTIVRLHESIPISTKSECNQTSVGAVATCCRGCTCGRRFLLNPPPHARCLSTAAMRRPP